MIRVAALVPILALLAGCVGVDRTAVEANAARIAPRVERDCNAAGAVKMGNTLAGSLVPVPGVAMVAAGLNAGWDIACANPEAVARAIGAAEVGVREFRDRAR